MRFSSEKEYLAKSFSIVARAIPSKSSGPLSRTMIRMILLGNSLNISATDIDTTIETNIEVSGIKDGTSVIPARLFVDIFKSMPEGKVTVTVEDELGVIEGGRARFETPTYPVEAYPPISPLEGEELSLPANEFSSAVSQVTKAASNDEIRPVLTGVYVTNHNDRLRLVATDSYRLSIRDVAESKSFSEANSVLVPARALEEVKVINDSLGSNIDTIYVRLTEGNASFRIGETTLTTQLINDKFPRYEQLIPKDYLQEITVKKSSLIEAFKRMRLLVKDTMSSVRLLADDGMVELSVVTPEIGNAKEQIDASVTGESTQLSFNPNYFIEGVEAAEGDEVLIRIAGKGQPTLIHSTQNEDYKYLLMPVRV